MSEIAASAAFLFLVKGGVVNGFCGKPQTGCAESVSEKKIELFPRPLSSSLINTPQSLPRGMGDPGWRRDVVRADRRGFSSLSMHVFLSGGDEGDGNDRGEGVREVRDWAEFLIQLVKHEKGM